MCDRGGFRPKPPPSLRRTVAPQNIQGSSRRQVCAKAYLPAAMQRGSCRAGSIGPRRAVSEPAA